LVLKLIAFISLLSEFCTITPWGPGHIVRILDAADSSLLEPSAASRILTRFQEETQ